MAIRDEDFGADLTLVDGDDRILVAPRDSSDERAARLAFAVRAGARPRGSGAGTGGRGRGAL